MLKMPPGQETSIVCGRPEGFNNVKFQTIRESGIGAFPFREERPNLAGVSFRPQSGSRSLQIMRHGRTCFFEKRQ